MSRPFDIIVFGATGFTGERICGYLLSLTSKNEKIRWAMAGRSESKLDAVRSKLLSQSNLPASSASEIALIVADVDNMDSLTQMASQARVVIAAAGPYRFFGESVVSACIVSHTHYVDVTGEPEFIEKIILNYHDKAISSNVTVVPSCGFDSIPADLGALYTERVFDDKFGRGTDSSQNSSSSASASASASLKEIDAYLSLNVGPKGHVGNTGTWYSLVHSLSSVGSLSRIRAALRSRFAGVTVPRSGKATVRSTVFTEKVTQGKPVYAMRFPGADASVVRNSQTLIASMKKRVSSSSVVPFYNAYFTVSSRFYLGLIILLGAVLKFSSMFSFTRNLLIKFPSFFSFGFFSPRGPTADQIKGCTFAIDFIGRGQGRGDSSSLSDHVIHTRVHGPEPGYVTTVIAVVQAAIQLLNDTEKKIPSGVLTPAAAFLDTNLISALDKAGIEFRTVSWA